MKAGLISVPALGKPAPERVKQRGHGTASSARAMPERILIVADDLTGACDSAAAFLASGRSVRVLLAPEAAGDEADVVAIATGSRDLAASEAVERVRESIERLYPPSSNALLFKKIDSAGRGNFAAEIEAALEASGAALALVTPAFPSVGRTLSNGVLSVRDWTGRHATIDLRQLFEGAGCATLKMAAEDELFTTITGAIEHGSRILLCDATQQADLERVAAAALRVPQPILWAGSAGLAHALAAQVPAAVSTPARLPRRTGRAMLFTGTPHPVTALQIGHLERAPHSAYARSIQRVPESGASHERVIAAYRSESPAALILTGGETASFVLHALGATSIRLAGEIAPGIPWGIIEGGLADGCTVVTKSGGFGAEDALLRAFEFCESEVASTQ